MKVKVILFTFSDDDASQSVGQGCADNLEALRDSVKLDDFLRDDITNPDTTLRHPVTDVC